jgi:hypothetical protein
MMCIPRYSKGMNTNTAKALTAARNDAAAFNETTGRWPW